MYNLNDLTVNLPADPFWYLYQAWAINDRGDGLRGMTIWAVPSD